MCWYFQSLVLCMYSYHPNAICSIKARYSYTAKDSIHTITDLNRWTDGDLEFSLERWKSLWRCTGFLRFSCSFSVPLLCETPSSNMSLDKAIESIARVQMETPCLLIWRIDGKPSSVKPGSRRGMSKKRIRTKGKHKKKNDVGTSTKKKVIE